MDIYRFLCGNCGYTADAAGDIGYTRLGKPETMICADCRIVTDVLIWSQSAYESEIGCCSNCKGTNLSKWAEPYACAKCDQAMNKMPAGMAC